MNMKVDKDNVVFISIRYADPISAMDLTDHYLLYGTMLGSAAYYVIKNNKLIDLLDTQEEHISGVKIIDKSENQDDSKFIVCIGDQKIVEYNSVNINSNGHPKKKEKDLYRSEDEHTTNCSYCFPMLKNDYLVLSLLNFLTSQKPKHKRKTRKFQHGI